jgi:hypothetical protein
MAWMLYGMRCVRVYLTDDAAHPVHPKKASYTVGSYRRR